MQNNFNVVRLFLAVTVVYSHSFAISGQSPPIVLGRDYGTDAVHVFFSVSGYLIARSWMRNADLIAFTVNRLLRVMPAIVPAKILTLLLLERFGHYSRNPIPSEANASLWTIPWEVTCYIACAVLGLLGVLRVERFTVFFAACWVVASAYAVTTAAGFPDIPYMLLFFLVGAFIAVQEDALPVTEIGRASLAFLAIVAAVETLAPGIDLLRSPISLVPANMWPILLQSAIVAAVSFSAVWIGGHARYVLPLDRDYSYGIYVFAYPIQQAVMTCFIRADIRPSAQQLFAASMMLVLPVAVLSWHMIEKPALGLRRLYPRAITRLRPLAGLLDGAGRGQAAGSAANCRKVFRIDRDGRRAVAELLMTRAVRCTPKTGFVLGFAAFCVATGLRRLVGPGFHGFPFVTYFPAVLATALAGGWIPALFYAVIEMAVAYVFFADPPYSFTLDNSSRTGLLMDTGVVVFEVLLVDCLRSALRNAHPQGAMARSSPRA